LDSSNQDKTSWADDDAVLSAMLSRVSQGAGDVLLFRSAVNGLHLNNRDGTTALTPNPALSPLKV